MLSIHNNFTYFLCIIERSCTTKIGTFNICFSNENVFVTVTRDSAYEDCFCIF